MANPGPRPVASAPGPRPTVRPAAKSAAAPPPVLDPLAAAKLAWRPTLKWCAKELTQSQWTDSQVLAAVQHFHSRVQAVMAAPDAAAFREAQVEALAAVEQHPFLRWARLPSPPPTL